MKSKRNSQPARDIHGRTPIEALTVRLEAMELREAMMKGRMDAFSKNEAALTSLREACTSIMAMQCAVYDSVANLYDLLRMPQAAERMRDQKREVATTKS